VALSKVQSVDQRMRLECGVGFRQLRMCRRTRPGQLCATNGSRPTGATTWGVKKDLGANALEHTKTPGVHQWHDSRQLEAGVLEERAIFRIRALHPPDVDQHL
jgi:hypothetical protein